MSESESEPVEVVHEDLIQRGVVAPVELGGAEERLWLDCDLASLAENRLGDTTDPREIDEARRADWRSRATEERPASLRSRSRFERCYWLLEGAERIGTLAVGTSTYGVASVYISSFYVLPSRRGRGAGSRALDRVKEALARQEMGLRLDTSWCWQRAVRFYLDAGMWLYMWKRELTFCWNAGRPPAKVEIGDREASLSVSVDGQSVLLASARRHGDFLELIDPPRDPEKDTRLASVFWNASSTFALHLALHGWPLVRSKEEWEASRCSDGGAPEGLAYKISIWEAFAKKHGWPVPTIRIPGLDYPTWDELEARWARAEAELRAELGSASGS